MAERRPPPPRAPEYEQYPPPREYDRRPPPPLAPPAGDYRRGPPPPLSPGARYDSREFPPPRRYDDYRGPPAEPYDNRSKRRRSLSPPPPRRDYHERDYPPRDDYRGGPRGDYPPRPHSPPYRGYPEGHYRGGPPPPSGGYYHGAPPPPEPEPEAPHHLPYIVTHRYFSDWFTRSNPPALGTSTEALELAWKKYLAEYTRRSLRPQFDELKSMHWFQEKYEPGPERELERETRRVETTKGRRNEWCELAEQGQWQSVTNEFDEEAVKPTESAPNEDKNGDTTMTADSATNVEGRDVTDQKPLTVLADGVVPKSAETVQIPARPYRIVITSVPTTVAYSDLHAVFAPLEGFVRLVSGDGQPFENWVRKLWVTFDTDEHASQALETLKETSIGEYKLVLTKQDQASEEKIRAAPAAMSAPDRIKSDLATLESIIEFLEKGEEEVVKKGSQVIQTMRETWSKQVEEKKTKGEDVTQDELDHASLFSASPSHRQAVLTFGVCYRMRARWGKQNRKALDLNLHYLRFAFHTCYYCATRCQSAEALESVCPRHVRRSGASQPDPFVAFSDSATDVAYVIGLDEKIPLLDDPDKIDLRDFGAELKEEVLFSLCSPHIKTEEEGKFRCKECNKLFSARKFVEKHIVTKHGQFVNDALHQVQFFNNFILDPAHHPLADFQRMNFLPSLIKPIAPLQPPPPLADRIGGRHHRSNGSSTPDKRQKRDGPPPPPPKGASLDPRAARVPSSYADLDGAPGGGPDVVALPY
ncbi:uncharacterized protein JCM15063_006064 [Sporobolomyces koalae]|uniref:uncharacterized protein n=1 Tax=Sporobolomyces koalae TaxID=500713 RepID=UPI00316EB7C5